MEGHDPFSVLDEKKVDIPNFSCILMQRHVRLIAVNLKKISQLCIFRAVCPDYYNIARGGGALLFSTFFHLILLKYNHRKSSRLDKPGRLTSLSSLAILICFW